MLIEPISDAEKYTDRENKLNPQRQVWPRLPHDLGLLGCLLRHVRTEWRLRCRAVGVVADLFEFFLFFSGHVQIYPMPKTNSPLPVDRNHRQGVPKPTLL